METAMKEVVRLEVTKDPTEVLKLCYKIQLGSVYQFPVITFHFKGADVKLETLNTFIRCVLMTRSSPTTGQSSWLGSLLLWEHPFGRGDDNSVGIGYSGGHCSEYSDPLG
ncbi:hypothetical protein TIFTF001_023257 [Ficus carica]|uniref:Uncharacterized protein n=1 Tax=Ficus carica TaxID=3494 RepID=A0AA88AEB4_FICCA|nr:hypothetical protein TIFTF001_023257 [Ficus carica]